MSATYKRRVHSGPPKRARGRRAGSLLRIFLLWGLPWSTGSNAGVASVPMPVSFAAVLQLPSRASDRDSTYGSASSQQGSLWLPDSSDPAPVVVLVHGGCWLSDYSAANLSPLATQLAAEGYAVWVPEYRRVGETGGGSSFRLDTSTDRRLHRAPCDA